MNPDAGNSQLTPLQKAAIALQEMRARLEASQRALHEPIAIVGMACRLPGGIQSLDGFWRALENGADLRSTVPLQRWDAEALYDPTPGTPGKSYVRHGYFVRDIDQFDPFFFEMSPREAKSLDPQHRLLLEVCWQTLQDARHPPEELSGTQCGVFIGIGQNDYAQRKLHGGDAGAVEAFDGTGNGFCFAAGRISHWLGVRGPNLAVDTACSSSLVALHLACQSLRLHECDFALAGGVQLMLSPRVNLFLSQSRALAPDGRSKAFDAAADGFGRGEGCGALALKRLADARRDGDRVLAVVRGSAVNHDGRSSGLTVPNPQAQQAVIRSALKNAGASPRELAFIETHGTGTALGDPIEARAIDAVFHDEIEQPIWLSSVKANIGHLEAAAGVTGVIKTVLCLQRRRLPKQKWFETPSPHIDWNAIQARVADQPVDFSGAGPICAGVSSFGISGTNCHVVLSSAPDETAKSAAVEVDVPFQRQRYWVDAPTEAPPALNDADALLQRLIASGEFSDDEQRLLPKFVGALRRIHHPGNMNLYEIAWREQALPSAPASHAKEAWLLIGNENSAAAAVKKKLRALGAQVMIAPNHVEQALKKIERIDGDVRGVLYFGALDAPATEQLDADVLRRSHETVCGFMLRLLRALLQKNIETPPKVWAVTQRVHALPGDAGRIALAQAPLHGFGKAAVLEHPELWGGVIDLGDPSDERELTALVNECLGGGNEMDVALRADKRFVSRLAAFGEPQTRPCEIGADATYWILGGLGALGLQTAQWLIDQGARTLVLTNRSGETEEDAAPLRRLRERGVTVQAWSGDVCDLAAMNQMAERIQRELPPLKGVIHAAGVGGVQAMQDIDEAHFHDVMRAKTLGAWNLLEATQTAPLDFIAFYSSIASVWGSKNQCHYAAANQFVDALACDAASQGRPAFAINWGPWPGEGMATQSDRDRLAQMGVMVLPAEALFRALQTLLSSSKPHAVAATVDWRRLSNLMEALGRQVFFEELAPLSNDVAEMKTQDGGVRQTIEALPLDERLDAIQLHILTTAAGILGYEERRLPDAHDGFFQLGMDSLLAVDLKDQLARSLNISLAAPAVFSYPNAHDLATYIFNECFEWKLEKQTVTLEKTKKESSKNSTEPPDDALAQKLANLESLINES